MQEDQNQTLNPTMSICYTNHTDWCPFKVGHCGSRPVTKWSEWACLRQQEMPIGLQVGADWQQMCLTSSGPSGVLGMGQGAGEKDGWPQVHARVHAHGYTTINRSTGRIPERCRAFLFHPHKLSRLEFASRPAAVWSYSVTSIKTPPLPSSLIKGVNNHPSLAVYYPLWQ